ncbi:ABC transporter ATP-binding protein [Variovorax sp. VNK109]|jgi:ABC-type polysaccharide/polyol phosphate transport system ATPase subunit|uniref:ABC transporter ATP-binding protein n=1 Tax=Variovorax sp. VNK109 TaxID=3400919 RepID=UPI003C072AE7
MPAPVLEVTGVGKIFHIHPGRHTLLKHRIVSPLRGHSPDKPKPFQALRDVSLSLRSGESVALLGANGSGKSTLLQLVAGILAPTTGHVRVNGRLAPLIELGVGFHPELSGRENVFLNAALMGMSNRQTANLFGEIHAFSGLDTFIDIPVKNYSSGMYMRLGFSVAIHTAPNLLLADEILAVGDAEFQQRCLDRVRALQTQGMALMLVTHSLEQAAQFCQRYIRLERGVVVDAGEFA